MRLEAATGALEVHTARLSPGWLEGGQLFSLPCDGEGWWRSGDAGRLEAGALTVLGRLDGAIHSGGKPCSPNSLSSGCSSRRSPRDCR